MFRIAVALDVGGTKLAAAVIGDDGTMLSRRQIPTPARESAETLGDAVLRVLADAIADAGRQPDAVGIGSAGPIDPAGGTVSPINIPAWRGFPIVDLVRRALPGRAVRLAGDGHCMALGEYWRGHSTSRALLGMVVSTGVGGGFVLDGEIQAGPTGNAGHIGHMVIDPRGPDCPCGGRGCVEMFASGPSILRWAHAQGWCGPDGTDTRGLADCARAGDPIARRAFDRAADAIALAVLCASALADLDDVVIGGGVATGAHDLLFGRIRDEVLRLAGPAFIRRVRIDRSGLGADAGLFGAAALALAATGSPCAA
ncbi:ROK family protein [Rugosimonospora africana]|uniref:Sugar kinase n=1 Tax=Rugosimonospora africana TaxID=556532 RepID=A0A8J3VNC4_9ACTN|nr:ROK family protein [Rugosimonospora africana]GIH12687.1 sugar kinase [Rugosimonospora africana]